MIQRKQQRQKKNRNRIEKAKEERHYLKSWNTTLKCGRYLKLCISCIGGSNLHVNVSLEIPGKINHTELEIQGSAEFLSKTSWLQSQVCVQEMRAHSDKIMWHQSDFASYCNVENTE